MESHILSERHIENASYTVSESSRNTPNACRSAKAIGNVLSTKSIAVIR